MKFFTWTPFQRNQWLNFNQNRINKQNSECVPAHILVGFIKNYRPFFIPFRFPRMSEH